MVVVAILVLVALTVQFCTLAFQRRKSPTGIMTVTRSWLGMVCIRTNSATHVGLKPQPNTFITAIKDNNNNN